MSFLQKILKGRIPLPSMIFCTVAVMAIALIGHPFHARAYPSLLKDSIVAFNIRLQKESLSDGTYRGEEGVLRIRPDIARTLGLQVPIEETYLQAKALNQKAKKYLEDAMDAMVTQKKEAIPGKHIRMLARAAAYYNRHLQAANKGFAAYHSKLMPDKDQRFDKDTCLPLLDRIVNESLVKTSYNLRDSLGVFYNRCQGLSDKDGTLNPENIRFVNHIFRTYVEGAPKEVIKQYDLDVWDGKNRRGQSGWERVVEKSAFPFIGLLERHLEDQELAGYYLDPLLFFALLRQESNFNPRAVSSVGAVGLTQIMPSTGKKLGITRIFLPPYYKEARSLISRERGLRHKAVALIPHITQENGLKLASRARKLMQASLRYGKKRSALFTRYKKELLKNGLDDRLNPDLAIKYGLRYFVALMRRFRGDISLAAAAYNAGPHRVKQYGGIPPFSETISFRNGLLGFYRGYLAASKR